MHKITIFLTLLLNLSILSFAQNNTILGNFGEPVNKVPGDTIVPPGNYYFNEGFRMPATRYEERIMRKAARLSLSRKEMAIYQVMQTDKKKKFSYYLRYPFIKYKYKKLQKLSGKSLQTTKKTSSRHKLSIPEKEILSKADSLGEQNLTPEEKKKYKKALRHKKRVDRYNKKHNYEELSEEDEQFLRKYENRKKRSKADTTVYTKEDRKKARQLKKMKRKQDKEEDIILQHKIDSAMATGAYLPVKQKKHFFRTLWYNTKTFFRRKFNSKVAPSSYMKKQKRIERRYKLTKKQQLAYNLYKSHKELSPSMKRAAKRAYTKEWIKKQKLKRLEEKEMEKLQPKWNKKMKKQRLKHSKKTNKQMFGKRK